MNRTELVYSSVMVLGVFLSSLSQVLLKKSSGKEHSSFLKEYLNLPVISAYFVFFIATFFSIFAFKVIPLSSGPILEATGYFFVTLWGSVFFKEKITLRKVIALCIILTGIIIYSIN